MDKLHSVERTEPTWLPIESAPMDGTLVYVYAAEREGLPPFITTAAYHPDAGWCVDELREVTHWMPRTSSSGVLVEEAPAQTKELIDKWRSEAKDKESAVRVLRVERQDLPADFFNYKLIEAAELRRCADELEAASRPPAPHKEK